jgi:mono/diheme cytochrome c family protein
MLVLGTPISSSVSEPTDGARLYKQYCKSCHGKKADRDNKKVPSLINSTLDDTAKIQLVRNGRNEMPAFSAQLTVGQIEEILDFLQTISKE